MRTRRRHDPYRTRGQGGVLSELSTLFLLCSEGIRNARERREAFVAGLLFILLCSLSLPFILFLSFFFFLLFNLYNVICLRSATFLFEFRNEEKMIRPKHPCSNVNVDFPNFANFARENQITSVSFLQHLIYSLSRFSVFFKLVDFLSR